MINFWLSNLCNFLSGSASSYFDHIMSGRRKSLHAFLANKKHFVMPTKTKWRSRRFIDVKKFSFSRILVIMHFYFIFTKNFLDNEKINLQMFMVNLIFHLIFFDSEKQTKAFLSALSKPSCRNWFNFCIWKIRVILIMFLKLECIFIETNVKRFTIKFYGVNIWNLCPRKRNEIKRKPLQYISDNLGFNPSSYTTGVHVQ